jgi:hypothetical protein
MSVLSLKRKNRFAGATGVNIADLKAAQQSTSMYSTESMDVAKALKDGSFESFDLSSVADGLKGALEPGFVASPENGDFRNPNGMAVASMIASLGRSAPDYLRMVSTESAVVDGMPTAQAYGLEYDSVYSTESFDNQNLTDHLSISIGLNYKISRQGPAMELVYRTIPLTPEQGTVEVEVPNLYVQNTLRHANDGSESDFGLRRVIDSHIDYQVLNDNCTQLVPGHNSQTAAMFVPTSVVTPFEYKSGRRTVLTSALQVGKTINLFGVGQTDAVSRVGQADYTEALDRNIGIESVFVTLGGETIRWDTRGLPFSRFYKGPEQGNRALKLDFPLTTLVINKDTVDYNGDALTGTVFQTIATGEYSVRLRTTLNGTADVERGTININPASLEVMSITNKAGEQISLTGTVGAGIVSGLAGLKTEGWWPDARLTNSNHRHLGLLLNVRSVKERLMTRVRSPFFVPYPVSEDRDQTVMDWLTFAVGAYINNEAVGSLIGYHERLMRLTGGLRGELTIGDFEENAMPIEGIGRYLINPYVQTLKVNVRGNAQSTSTIDNIKNGQEVIINVIRSISFDIQQRTNYENACRYVDGGEISKAWKVALVTSKKIERFMTVSGDSRTLGAGLPFQLESDVDARLDKKIYMTLVREGDGIDPLSSGVMLLTPTLVSTLSVTRDNAPRQEAVVQPRFQHYNLLPIIVMIEVEGVDELLEETLPFRVENTPVVVEAGGTDPVAGNDNAPVDGGAGA